MITRRWIWFVGAIVVLLSSLQVNLAYGQGGAVDTTQTLPALIPGETNTSLKMTFLDFFDAYDVNAYEIQWRRKSPAGAWQVDCHVVDVGSRGGGNFSDSPLIGIFFAPGTRAGYGNVTVIFHLLEPGATYEVRYRDTNLTECGPEPEEPDPWSPFVEARTRLRSLPRVEFADEYLAWLVRSALEIDVSGKHIERKMVPEEEMPNLGELSVPIDDYNHLFQTSHRISDLTGMESAVNLTTFDLESQAIIDLSPLADLRRLTHLNLEGNQIQDISPLSQLSELTFLGLGSNQIQDLSPLSNLTHLTRLFLGGNQIEDLIPLSQLTQLEWLYLEGNQISHLSGIERLTLSKFSIKDNEVSSLAPLNQWTQWSQFTEFDISNNQISDIGLLANLAGSEVKKLDLSNNQIVDITPLGPLAQSPLADLDLRGNQIVDITPLAEFVNSSLVYLSLMLNRIRDISPLENLVQLFQLFLWGNPIEDKSPLFSLVNANPNMFLDIDVKRIEVITPAPLTGANLNGAVITLKLKGGEFYARIPDIEVREILQISGIEGVSISQGGVGRVSPTEVVIVLSFDQNVSIEENTTLMLTLRGRIFENDGSSSDQITVRIPVLAGVASTPDFDGNGVVNFEDFFLFADVFGSLNPHFDLDGSGRVDFEDFFVFADAFRQSGR